MALPPRDCAGLEARRALPSGSIVMASDLMPQQLVRRGEPVMIRVVSGGLTISASGRALASGAKGEMVRVVTNTTSRTLDGIVDGTGSVRIVAP
jgi:flagella basal body P-ring formation protein FlgA